MTKRDSAIAIGAWAAATGFALALTTRRARSRTHDVTMGRTSASRTVTVRRDASALYGLWREPSLFPRFFHGVRAVEVQDGMRQRWTIGDGKRATIVDVAVVDDAPDERIAWRTPVGRYPAQASVTFTDAGARGTEVRLALGLDGPTARTAIAFARLFGSAPPHVAAESLRNFKAFAETGEIPKAVRN